MGVFEVSEFAKIANVSTKTIYRWIRSGRISAVKIGRRWRVVSQDDERRIHLFWKYDPLKVRGTTWSIYTLGEAVKIAIQNGMKATIYVPDLKEINKEFLLSLLGELGVKIVVEVIE